MADMSRRRSVGNHPNESRKRKYVEREVEIESDNNGSSIDFPCGFCSAVFVTRISLNRHMLTFHDAAKVEVNSDQGIDEDQEETALYEENYEDQEIQSEDGSAYYENEDDSYYMTEEPTSGRPAVIQQLIETSEPEINFPASNDFVLALNGSNNKRFPHQKGIKPKLSSDHIAIVLAQAEEITSNTTSEYVACPLCHKTFGRKELSIHINCEHGGAKFTCPYCGRSISRRDHLKRHIKNVHPDMCTETEIGPFPRNLNLSRASTNSQKKLASPASNNTNHLRETPTKILPISIVTPRITVVEDDDEDDDFEGEDDLVHDGNSQQTSRDSYESQDQQDSMQITVEPDLPYDLNDMDYNEDEDDYNTPNFLVDSLQQFHDHRFINSEVMQNGSNGQKVAAPFQCSLCAATFASKVLLDRHESTHSELRPHKCSVCGKGFLRKEHLSKHLSSVHSGMKFTCEFCGKDISRKDHLIRHIRNVHPTQFYSLPQDMDQELTPTLQAQQQSLLLSFKTVQNIQPKQKKPFFGCDMCEATFINVDDLHTHQATVHSDVRKYKCNYCCKAFKRKEHLTKHEVLHTGERKFTCRVCGNEFQRKDALQEHIKRTHGGVESIANIAQTPCNLCDQHFSDRSSLLSHMTTAHGLIVNSPPGLPKTSNQQRQSNFNYGHSKALNVVTSNTGNSTKPVASISSNNLGSLMDLINKGSITLSFQPVKSEGNY